MYISTGYAKPRHRAYNHILTCSLDMFLRTLKHYGSILVWFVVSFREPCSTTKLEFGITWGPFWWPGAPFWCLFGGLDHPWSPVGPLWGKLSKKGSFFRRSSVHFGYLFGTKVSKVVKNFKKQCPETSVENMCSQSPSQMAKSWFSIINTICFERPDIIHLGGFDSHFGSLLESLLGTRLKTTLN